MTEREKRVYDAAFAAAFGRALELAVRGGATFSVCLVIAQTDAANLARFTVEAYRATPAAERGE